MGGNGGEIEVDETLIGGKAINMHKGRKLLMQQIRSERERGDVSPGKTAVQGLLDRDQRTIRAEVVPNVRRETLQAAIAAVDGIDGVFIGPSDLAADFGHLASTKHPEVQAAITDGCKRIRGAGKAAGMLTSDPEEIVRYLEMDFTFIAVGSDVGVLARGCEKLAAQIKTKIAPAKR